MAQSNNRNINNDFSGDHILKDQVGGNGFIDNDDDDDNKTNFYDLSQRNLAHLTIKQIVTAFSPSSDASEPSQANSLIIDKREVSEVMLYGTVKSIDRQTIHTKVVISDYTGRIPLTFWNSNENVMVKETLETLRPNMICKVTGRIKIFNNLLGINAYNIWPLNRHKNDFMEIGHFFIEAIFAHLVNTADPQHLKIMDSQNQSEYKAFQNQYKQQHQKKNNNRNNNNSNNSNNNNNNNNNQNWRNNRNHNNNNNNNNKSNNQRNNFQLKSKIYKIIQNDVSDEGCSKDTILNKISGQSLNDISNAMEEMLKNDAIFETVDSNHFRTTE